MQRAGLARLLWPLSQLMRVLVSLRRGLYRAGVLRSGRVPVPVLVVGNLVAGGAGKTPIVLAVVASLRAQGHRPAIVSRGYGRSDDQAMAVTPQSPANLAGDEPLLLRLRSGVPVWVGRDRLQTARALLRAHPDTSVIVCDDGLQHLALARDLQLLVFDERGTGNGWLLPAGPLREPLPAPGKTPNGVRTLVVYNAPRPTTRLPGSCVAARLRGAVELAAWWRGEPAERMALESLRGRRLLAAAGMARPQRFFAMLREAGLDIDELPLPDHFAFTTLPWPSGTTDLLLTEKDAVKLDPGRLGSCRAWVVPLDLELDQTLVDQIRQALPASVAQPTHDNDRDGHSIA